MSFNNQNSLFKVTRACTSESQFNSRKDRLISDYLFSVVLSVKIILIDRLSQPLLFYRASNINIKT